MKPFFKKILSALLLIVIVGIGFFWHTFNKRLNPSNICAFCSPEVLQTHTFYEDNLVRGLCSYKPIEAGHCLIIPKRHIQQFEEASIEEITAMGGLIKKVNTAIQKINGPSAYLLLQKNGREVGQTVPHVHFHYIPKKISSSMFGPCTLMWHFITEPFRSPLPPERLAEWVDIIHTKITTSV